MVSAEATSQRSGLANLPAALQPLVREERWVCWRWERHRERVTKVPYQPRSPLRHAKSNDPGTWADHRAAVAVVEAGDADGIGFMLTDSEYAAFDLDDCRDPETGRIEPWAAELVSHADSYAEVTVSRTGIRIIGTAAGEHVHRKQAWPGTAGSVETYRRATRFIVVTGDAIHRPDEDLKNIDALIDETVAKLDDAARREPPRGDPDRTLRYAMLPPELRRLIEHGVPEGQRSDQFHHAVRWLKSLGWDLVSIIGVLEQLPNGIASKYAGRIATEAARSFGKPDGANDGAAGASQSGSFELHWHGERPPTPRPWLVSELAPETGAGLLAGQWGTGKTFVALDLAASVMTGAHFAGHPVSRTGGVLFIAAEGASEIPPRLQAIVEQKLNDDRSASPLPFAWIEACPPLLSDAHALNTLVSVAAAAATRLRSAHDLPLALIVVDTVAASAGFSNENEAAEAQKVMNILRSLSQATGALVIGVDHFGKLVETGVRGSSAKEAAADMVLALLADRDVTGSVSNTRMAVRKLRGGKSGAELPFSLRVVPLASNSPLRSETSCVIDWRSAEPSDSAERTGKDRWPKSLRIFRAALLEALLQHGEERHPFGADGAATRVVPQARVRAEFLLSHPADGDDEAKRLDAKRKAFNRALSAALERAVVGSRELGGIDYLWLADGS